MYKANRKRKSLIFIVIAILMSGLVYVVFKNYTDKGLEIKPKAPSNQSVESGLLFKKVRNQNISEGYTTSDIEEINLNSLEQTGEKALADDDYYRISSEDNQPLTSKTNNSSLYQRYKIKIDKDLTGLSTYQIKWQGKSSRTVDMYGWDYTKSSWVLLNYSMGRDSDNLTVTADLDTNTMIKDSVANVIVGTARKNSILKGKVPERAEYDFTFAWLSDTQYYSASYPEIYSKMTKYIADKAKEQNVAYAIHTGDLVDNMDSASQWKNADQSMKLLEKAKIPYGVLAGNHDVGHTAYNYSEFSNYFGENRFKNNSVFGETPNNNRDHYDLVSVGGKDFIIVYLGWGLKDSSIDWANDVLKKNSGRMAILCTHGYINGRGTYVEQGKDINEKIVVPNKNVFMVLSGHYGGAAVNVKRSDNHVYYEMMANYQFNAEGGAGYFRMLHFDAKNNLVYVDTYSPYKNDYNFYEDEKEQFIIPINQETGEVDLNTDVLAF